ncbi:MAG: flagellar export protein FliJ [Alphaproteobacteria bacterium]
MRSREAMVRLGRFQVEEKKRKVGQIELMIADFERRSVELEEQIRVEQERSGIHDAGHFAYPTFAKAAAERRDNLHASVEDLKVQLDAANMECDTALEELQKTEALAVRDAGPVNEEVMAVGGVG